MAHLIFSIVMATILGFCLLFLDPLVGGVIAFGIIAGCLFRGLYLLHEIYYRVTRIAPSKDKVKEAYTHYLSEKSRTENKEV
jgi:hypothetical protein